MSWVQTNMETISKTLQDVADKFSAVAPSSSFVQFCTIRGVVTFIAGVN